MNPNQKRALAYFYPNGGWGGYAKWFEPHISGKIGCTLLAQIEEAIKRLDERSRLEAIATLSTSHIKTVAYLKGVPPQKVHCYPTEEAKIAVQFLEGLLPRQLTEEERQAVLTWAGPVNGLRRAALFAYPRTYYFHPSGTQGDLMDDVMVHYLDRDHREYFQLFKLPRMGEMQIQWFNPPRRWDPSYFQEPDPGRPKSHYRWLDYESQWDKPVPTLPDE